MLLTLIYDNLCMNNSEQMESSTLRRFLRGIDKVCGVAALLLGILAVTGVLSWGHTATFLLLGAGGLSVASLLLYSTLTCKVQFCALEHRKLETRRFFKLLLC